VGKEEAPNDFGSALTCSADNYVILYKPSAKEKAYALFDMKMGDSDEEAAEGEPEVESSSCLTHALVHLGHGPM